MGAYKSGWFKAITYLAAWDPTVQKGTKRASYISDLESNVFCMYSGQYALSILGYA
jgi:hypothetical protein